MQNSGDLIFNNLYFFQNDYFQNFIYSLQSRISLNKSYFALSGTLFYDFLVMINSSLSISNSFFLNFKSTLFAFYLECQFELVKSIFKQKSKLSLPNYLLFGRKIILIFIDFCFFSQIFLENTGQVICF